MKFTSLVVLVIVSPLTTGFAPTSNQRQLGSNNNNQAFVNAARTTSSLGSISMNIPAFLGAGAISLGLLNLTGEQSVTIYAPSVVVSASTVDVAISSTQSPSALKEVEKKLLQEVKEAEKEAKNDAKVSFIILIWMNCWIVETR